MSNETGPEGPPASQKTPAAHGLGGPAPAQAAATSAKPVDRQKLHSLIDSLLSSHSGPITAEKLREVLHGMSTVCSLATRYVVQSAQERLRVR